MFSGQICIFIGLLKATNIRGDWENVNTAITQCYLDTRRSTIVNHPLTLKRIGQVAVKYKYFPSPAVAKTLHFKVQKSIYFIAACHNHHQIPNGKTLIINLTSVV